MIRRAAMTDMDRIFGVHSAAVHGIARAYYSPAEVDVWAGRKSPKSYATSISARVIIVDEEAEVIRGFAQLDPGTSSIEAVYVDPAYLRQGVGSRLLAALESIAGASGTARLTLDASLNSVPFYESAGYARVADSLHELSPGISIACVLMQKELRSAA